MELTIREVTPFNGIIGLTKTIREVANAV